MNSSQIAELSQEENQYSQTFSPESHSFNVGIATVTKSVNAAIVFNHLIFWLKHNKACGKNQIEGRTWMYQTMEEMQAHFPYLSFKQVRIGLDTLEKYGFILKGSFNENKFDRTTWYALKNEEFLGATQKKHTNVFIEPLDNSKSLYEMPCEANGIDVQGKCSNKDKDNKTDNKTYIGGSAPPPPHVSISSSKKKYKPATVLYRENVRLKEGEYEKLCQEMGKEYLDYWIESLDDYITSKGAKYANHAKTIQIWHKRALKEGKLPKVGGGSENQLESLQMRLQANRGMCQTLEEKLRRSFTSAVLMQAGPEKVLIYNKHKDFQKEYRYADHSVEEMRSILIKDLSVCFPNVPIRIGGADAKDD